MIPDTRLMIHGGAGDFSALSAQRRGEYLAATREILARAYERLASGASAVDVVEYCVTLLEDNVLFNAGRGSVLNEFGMVEMDAAIMQGRDLASGAVAAVRQLRNPIALARRLLDAGTHVLLVGEGAQRYARQAGLRFEDEGYFLSERRLAQLRRARHRGRIDLDHAAHGAGYSTVGAVARDRHGDLAAATSTGGMTNKRWGRVGDSALIGAGVYADNLHCAVSATGVGEHIMRFVLGKALALVLPDEPQHAAHAIESVMGQFVERLRGEAGIILIDRWGQGHARHTTQGMVHGWVAGDGRPESRVD